ncbi:MAG: PDZ domain-containing protein, partial [Gammaproteobacteria bacterium]|nr:PDZ domain-containing protein [Gammaproteobacteria bacterium]
LQVGDVIVEYDGKPVYDSSRLPPLVGMTPLNTRARLKVIREGRPVTISVTIGELPDQVGVSSGDPDERHDSSFVKRLGISVMVPGKQQKKELGLDEPGLLVSKVLDGPAREAGVQKGDIIIMFNGEKVKTLAGLKGIVKKLPDNKSVPVLIQRSGGPLFLALKLSSK